MLLSGNRSICAVHSLGTVPGSHTRRVSPLLTSTQSRAPTLERGARATCPTSWVCVPPDSSDSELELSAVRHQPEGLDQLQAQTKFTKKELQSLYRGFKNVSAPHPPPPGLALTPRLPFAGSRVLAQLLEIPRSTVHTPGSLWGSCSVGQLPGGRARALPL